MPMPGYLPELFADPHLAVRPLRIRGPMKAPGNTGGARKALCRSPWPQDLWRGRDRPCFTDVEGEDIRGLSPGLQRKASEDSERGGLESARRAFSLTDTRPLEPTVARSWAAKILEIDVSVAR